MSYGEFVGDRMANVPERRKTMKALTVIVHLESDDAITISFPGRTDETITIISGRHGLHHPYTAEETKIKAKDILTDASKWTQFTDSRDADDRECEVDDDRAVAFSLSGALRRAYSGKELVAAIDRVGEVIGPLDAGIVSIRVWNDDKRRTFEEVRRVIEKADV
jgi:hypothetical protein